MHTPITLTLKQLGAPPKLDAKLPERVKGALAVLNSRAIPAKEMVTLDADFNGDGVLDHFQLSIRDGLSASLSCTPSLCTLLVPGGTAGVVKLIPADLNQDSVVDFYLETKAGDVFMLENNMDAAIHPLLDRSSYRTHLLGIATLTLGPKGFWDAVRRSIALTTGQSHTWVLPDPKPRYPWIEGTPPHTDCVIELERVLAELHNPTGKFTGFQRAFNRIQKYDFKGPERTDFFTAEAVPHLTQLGMIRDITAEVWQGISTDPMPHFEATISKEKWFRAGNNGQPSGKDFPEWKQTLTYIPFEQLLEVQQDGSVALQPEIAAALPPVSIFVLLNKGRVQRDTEIPDSHVAFLIKNPQTGGIHIRHSTSTTDLGVASTTVETVSSYFQTRYRKVVDGKLSIIDKKAVGVQLLTFLPPKNSSAR